MALTENEQPSWLKPTRVSGFDSQRYTDSNSELHNFASRMGQFAEAATIKLICQPTLRREFSCSVQNELDVVRSRISRKIKHLPDHRPTFRNVDLMPAYVDSIYEPETLALIFSLAKKTDTIFGSQLEQELETQISGISIQKNQEYYGGIHPKTRYLIDALVANAKLSSDKDTLQILKHFGNLVPDVHIGSTQIDGIFISRDLGTAPEGNRTLDFLKSLTKKSASPLLPSLLKNCSTLEIKLNLQARSVAQRPASLSLEPRKIHIQQVRSSLMKSCKNSEMAIVPDHQIILSLGSMQPNLVYVMRADSMYWHGLANEAEEMMANPPLNHNPDYFDGVGIFYNIANDRAIELEKKERVEKRNKEKKAQAVKEVSQVIYDVDMHMEAGFQDESTSEDTKQLLL